MSSTISTIAAAPTDGRPLPEPPLRRQPALIRQVFSNAVPVLDELGARHGPMFSLGRGPARIAFVGDPVAIGEMFAMPVDWFRWNHRFNVLRFVVGKESMIVSDGADHRRRRAAVQHGFSRRRLNRLVPMMVERTDVAIDSLVVPANGAPVDLYPVIRSLVVDIVVHTLFGARLAGRVEEIGELFERAQAYLESPALRQLPHPFPHTRRAAVRADRRAFDALVDEELALRRREQDHDPDDLLAVLALDDTLSDSEIRDQVDSLIGAGFHTTAATISWMLWRATTHPELWAALRAEADDAFSTEPDDHVLLQRLELANRVMRETMRLHPAGVVGVREARRNITLDGYRIPAGTMVLWSPYLAGRNRDAWPDPLRFDPDRFLDPTDEQQALMAKAWVPFGGGARNCIGFGLAQMELTIMLARWAQRVDLRPPSTAIPAGVGMIASRPDGGVPMHVSRR